MHTILHVQVGLVCLYFTFLLMNIRDCPSQVFGLIISQVVRFGLWPAFNVKWSRVVNQGSVFPFGLRTGYYNFDIRSDLQPIKIEGYVHELVLGQLFHMSQSKSTPTSTLSCVFLVILSICSVQQMGCYEMMQSKDSSIMDPVRLTQHGWCTRHITLKGVGTTN